MKNVWYKVYAKAIAAAAAALGVAAAALADGKIDSTEWIGIGLAVLGVLAVERVPNAPEYEDG